MEQKDIKKVVLCPYTLQVNGDQRSLKNFFIVLPKKESHTGLQ